MGASRAVAHMPSVTEDAMVRCPQSQRFLHPSLLQIAKQLDDFAMLRNIRSAQSRASSAEGFLGAPLCSVVTVFRRLKPYTGGRRERQESADQLVPMRLDRTHNQTQSADQQDKHDERLKQAGWRKKDM